MMLVPCRWSKTGFKYVEVDPNKTKFFTAPHRINGQGMNLEHQNLRVGRVRDGRSMSTTRGFGEQNDQFLTSN